MKKKIAYILLFITLLTLPCFAFALSYTCEESGISFVLPTNWERTPLTADREIIRAKFVPSDGSVAVICYGVYDIWSSLASNEKIGMQRADMDINSIPKGDIISAFDSFGGSVTEETYGGMAYYKTTFSNTMTIYDVDIDVQNTVLMTVHNGYMYQFQYYEMEGEGLSNVFYEMVRNVNYPAVEKSAPTVPSILPSILSSLLLTAGVYTAPIAVYRYLVVGEPIEEKKAKKITTVYAIVSFIIMSLILNSLYGQGTAGYSIVLWSGINYALLTKGRKVGDSTAKDSEDQAAVLTMEHQIETSSAMNDVQAQSPAIMEVPEKVIATKDINASVPTAILFCHKCGNKLVEGSVFCNKCGAKIR